MDVGCLPSEGFTERKPEQFVKSQVTLEHARGSRQHSSVGSSDLSVTKGTLGVECVVYSLMNNVTRVKSACKESQDGSERGR